MKTNLKLVTKHRQPHIPYRLKSIEMSLNKINISVLREAFCSQKRIFFPPDKFMFGLFFGAIISVFQT